MRTIARTLLTAFLGCLIISLVAPAIRLAVVHQNIGEAHTLISGGSVGAAALRLRRFQPWALRYPVVAERLVYLRTSCHVRLEQLIEAQNLADWIHDRDIAGAAFARPIVHSGPDWLVNMIVESIDGREPHWNRDAGYNAILVELERGGEFRKREDYARNVLEKSPGNARAREIVAIVDDPAKASRDPGTAATTTAPASIRPPRPATPANDGMARLRNKEAQLVARIRARQAELAKTPATHNPAQAEFDRISAQLSAEQLKAQSLQQEFNTATGSRRGDVMDELQRMKGPLARMAADYNAANAKLNASPGASGADPDSDPAIQEMKQELDAVRDQMRDTSN
jgi:hypothetical protein